jgi:uncharacterized damage-inducible protein DinB
MNAKELFGHWNEVRNGLLAALDKLTDAQLDFKPREGLWSLRETVVHIAGYATTPPTAGMRTLLKQLIIPQSNH